jgi:hypothetical protein
LFAQGRVELLDSPEIEREFKMLERHMVPGGKIKIDHPRSAHDDHANSFAIAATIATQGRIDTRGISLVGERRSTRRGWLDDGDEGGSTISRAWDSGALFRKSW